MAYFVYLARCADGSLYTGIARDPVARAAAHNAGRGGAYTRSRRPVTLVHVEPAPDRAAAQRREWALKQLSKSDKESLVARPRKAKATPPAARTSFRGFGEEAFRFLRGLKRHNTREWFARHREDYESAVRDPLRALVEELDVRLARLAPEIVGEPKRSLFRIHRDVRFSKDKSPYKTHAACWLYHRDAGRSVGREAASGGAGFYFHLEPGACIVAGGIWMPARPALRRLREAIAEDPKGFGRIARGPALRRRYGGLDEEAMLTRLPRGYAPGHPAEPWLRHQSFTVHRPLEDRIVLGRRLASVLARDFAAMLPLVRWLNRALGFPEAKRRV